MTFKEYCNLTNKNQQEMKCLIEKRDSAQLVYKEFIKIKKKVNNSLGCKNIFTKACVLLEDNSFLEQLNTNIYNLPIKGGKIINVKTLEVRDRLQSDYFSYECPVSFHMNTVEGIETEFEWLGLSLVLVTRNGSFAQLLLKESSGKPTSAWIANNSRST